MTEVASTYDYYVQKNTVIVTLDSPICNKQSADTSLERLFSLVIWVGYET